MSVNKNKVTALAQKYTAKGQFEKAIGEYKKLLLVDPNDIRTWLKMGDLYTRMGARQEATETYLKVAEHYKKSGFHLKAVAVYKQVLKLDPTQSDVYELLGDAYLSLGLSSEALIQFEQLADTYQRNHASDKLLHVLERMALVDPQNLSTRLRIAEQLSKDGDTQAAVEQFYSACEQLRAQGRVEDFLKVAERLLYHDGSRVDIAREAASLYLQRQQPKRALAKLQVCFASDPRNVDTLELLAEAFTGLNQPDKAVSVYRELVHILDAQKLVDDKRRILAIIDRLDPSGAGAVTAASSSQRMNSDLPSPAKMAAEGDYLQEETDLVLTDEEIAAQAETLLNEAEVLLKYGLIDRAKDHFAKIFEIDYFNMDARERFKDVCLESGDKDGATSQLLILAEGFAEEQPEGSVYFLHEILRIDSRHRRAREMIKMLGGVMPEGLADLDEVGDVSAEDEFLSMVDLEEGVDDTDEVVVEGDDDDDLDDEFIIDEEPARSSLGEISELTIDDVPYLAGDNELSELDLVDGEVEWEEEKVIEVAEDQPITKRVSLAEMERENEESRMSMETVPPPAPVPVPPLPKPSILPRPSPRSKSAALPKPNSKVPPRPPRPKTPERPTRPDAPSVEPPKPVVASASESLPDISEELEEIEFFCSQELEEEAVGIVENLLLSYPDDPRVQQAARRVGLSGSDDGSSVSRESGLDLDQLAGDMGLDEENDAADAAAEIDAVFSQFKAGVEKQISESDHATHFDLGQAYKEMGLFDDAISEFNISAGDPARVLTSQLMIGMCHAGAGRPDKAIEIFDGALGAPGSREEERLALMYEKAKLLAELERKDEALEVFNNILNVDPGFADVVDRVDALERGEAPERTSLFS